MLDKHRHLYISDNAPELLRLRLRLSVIQLLIAPGTADIGP